MQHTECSLCGSEEHTLFKAINDYRLVKCARCGLVYLNPRPAQQEIREQYSAWYHLERVLRQDPKTEKEIEEEIDKNIGRAEEIVKQFGDRGKLLDIGCGAGLFLACIRRYGWNVTGVDVSEWATAFARDKLGLDVFTGSVEHVRCDKRFDVVTMYHVLEHLPDPLATLERVLEMSADSGVLVVKGPNLASFDRLWHGEDWRGYDLPFHLHHFDPRTYRLMLRKAGFAVKRVIFQYWDPFAHFVEARLGDGVRADHPSDALVELYGSGIYNSVILRGTGRIINTLARLLGLKGRDVTIHAGRADGL